VAEHRHFVHLGNADGFIIYKSIFGEGKNDPVMAG